MKSRFGWAVLCVFTSVLTTGCESECTTAADCVEDNRPAGEGQEFACVENSCVLRNIAEPETDAGEVVDAGEETDAGEMDGGEDMDAGTLAKSEPCTRGSECGAGLFCESGADGGSTCQALWIAYTVGSGATARPSVARWDEPGSNATIGADTSGRWPRFGPNGDALVFERGDGTEAPSLVRRDLPLSATGDIVLVDAADAGTDSFVHLEWAEGEDILFTRDSMDSLSGIMSVDPAGGAPTELSPTGVFPTWQGTSIVFSSAAEGLLLYDGTSTNAISGGAGGIEPQTNELNDLVAYRETTGTESIGGVATELDELWTVPASGGTATVVAEVSSADQTTGSENSFIASHVWSPNGALLAFVRAWYSIDGVGNTALCGGANVFCPRAATDVMLISMLPVVATETLLESNATLPSFSPDGRYVSYVQGARLVVQEIDPMTGVAVGDAITHTTGGVATNLGDDSRPRWQPKP